MANATTPPHIPEASASARPPVPKHLPAPLASVRARSADDAQDRRVRYRRPGHVAPIVSASGDGIEEADRAR